MIDEWKRDIEVLAKFENVMCKVSGIITEADWKNWTYEQIEPYLEVVFEAFGIDRIMYGSDWPVCLVAGEYAQVKGIVEKYTQNFSETEKAKIFGGNAAKFYKI
jgi:L-fuconolactonase